MMRKTLLILAATAIMTPAAGMAADPATAMPGQGPRMGTKPMEVLMTKITVTDLQKSYDFYTQVMGLKPVSSPDMPMPGMPRPGDPEKDFVEVPLNYSGSIADPLFLLMKRRGRVPTAEQAGLVTIGFKVPNTAAVMERAKQAGFMPARSFTTDGRVGFLKDPDGYSVEILQPPSF